MDGIILYSNNCPQCKVLKAKLDQKGIWYQEVNDVDLMLRKGFMSMPMLEVDGLILNFAQALKWATN